MATWLWLLVCLNLLPIQTNGYFLTFHNQKRICLREARLPCHDLDYERPTHRNDADLPSSNHMSIASHLSLRRRNLLSGLLRSLAISTLLGPVTVDASWFDNRERRQLELCLAAVLRVVYWADNELTAFSQPPIPTTSSDSESAFLAAEFKRKTTYVEARLGAKAALTGKAVVGSGSNGYELASLQLSECLQDLDYYFASENTKKKDVKEFEDLVQEWREALASLVEFDGFDTLSDPSPRSSLTMTQYTEAKSLFVQRVLREKVVPIGQQVIDGFDSRAVERSRSYVRDYFPIELPASLTSIAETQATTK